MAADGDITESAGGMFPTPEMDENQSVVHRWLKDIDPETAQAYASLLTLLAANGLPLHENLVCHVARDILDRLPTREKLKSSSSREKPGYWAKVQAVADVWPSPIVAANDTPTANAERTIPLIAFASVGELLIYHREKGSQNLNQNNLASALAILHGGRYARDYKSMALRLTQLRKWFVARAHVFPKEAKNTRPSEAVEQVASMTRFLRFIVDDAHAIVQELTTVLERANAQPHQPPNKDDVEVALAAALIPMHMARLFDHLHNPHWIEPLSKKGAFAVPPDPVEHDDGSVEVFGWPASSYLARMASSEPTLVASIMAERETTNHRVVLDMLDAAMEMPPAIAATLTDRLAGSLRAIRHGYWISKAGKLIARLMSGGQKASGRTLLKAMLTPDTSTQDSGWSGDWGDMLAMAMRDDIAPAMARHDPEELLRHLCKMLLTCISGTTKSKWRHKPGANISLDAPDLDRPAVHLPSADFSGSSYNDTINLLGLSIEKIIEAQTLDVADIHATLTRKKSRIFHRIAMVLLARHGHQAPQRTADAIFNELYMEHRQFLAEYVHLLEKRFESLTPEQREAWFERIKAGPGHFPEYYQSDESKDSYRHEWVIHRLSPVVSFFGTKGTKLLDRLRRELGHEPSPVIHEFEARSLETTSPFQLEELTEMGIATALAIIRDWRPKPGASRFDDESYDGLRGVLEEFIKASPRDAALHAAELHGAEPWLLGSYFWELHKQAEVLSGIDPNPLLALATTSLERARAASHSDSEALHDHLNNWEWAIRGIGYMLEAMTVKPKEDGVSEFGKEHRDAMWKAIDALFEALPRATNQGDVEGEDPRRAEYFQAMLNRPEGLAVRAMLRFAHWVFRVEGHDTDGPKGPSEGWAVVPEVRTRLEEELGKERRTIAGSAAIAERLGFLLWIDRDWLKDHAGQIFPLIDDPQSESEQTGWAALSVFLVLYRGEPIWWELFEATYRKAIETVSNFESLGRGRSDWSTNLGIHLIELYSAQAIGMGDGGVLADFLSKAPNWLRVAVLAEYALRLSNTKRKLSTGFMQRLEALWEFYWDRYGTADASEEGANWAFAPWFASGHSSAEWSLEQMRKVVEAGIYPQPAYTVAKRLKGLAKEYPLEAVTIMGGMVRAMKHDYDILGWVEAAKSILRAAHAAGDQADATAKDIESFLYRLGMPNFLDLGNDEEDQDPDGSDFLTPEEPEEPDDTSTA